MKKYLIWMFQITLLVIICSGCSANSEALTKLQEENDDLKEKYESIQKEIGDLNDKLDEVDELQVQYNDLNSKIANIFRTLTDYSFHLDINGTGYVVSNTEYGIFTLSIEKVEEYLNGYNVSFRLGNIMAADFTGAKFYVVVDNIASDGSKVLRANSIDDEVTIYTYTDYYYVTYNELDDIDSGSWHNFTVTIPNVTLDDIENLTIIPQFSSMSLRR